jgi:hypothetical protein
MATIRERRVARTAFNPGGAVSFSSSGGTRGPKAAPTHHESPEERERWVRIAVALYPTYNKLTASEGFQPLAGGRAAHHQNPSHYARVRPRRGRSNWRAATPSGRRFRLRRLFPFRRTQLRVIPLTVNQIRPLHRGLQPSRHRLVLLPTLLRLELARRRSGYRHHQRS